MIRLATNSFSWHPTYNKGIGELSALEICRRAAAAGAEGIEMDPSQLTATDLSEAGIALSGASTGGPLFDDWTTADADRVVATAAGARALGGEYVFFTIAPKGGWGAREQVTEEDLRLAGERLSALARRVRAEGLAVGLHNHAASPEGLAAELSLLAEHTVPDLVGLYLDIGWAYCGDGDPVALIERFGPRLMGLHFRNHTTDKVPTQMLCEGALHIPGIVAALTAADYEGWASLELWHREDVPVAKSMQQCQTESLCCLKMLFEGRTGAG